MVSKVRPNREVEVAFISSLADIERISKLCCQADQGGLEIPALSWQSYLSVCIPDQLCA